MQQFKVNTALVGFVALCCIVSAEQHSQQQQHVSSPSRKEMVDEIQLINKSIEGLLSEIDIIKREATGRLSKSRLSADNSPQAERIRQTKVSRFVLKRIAELEHESSGMRDEINRLFQLQQKQTNTQDNGSSSPTNSLASRAEPQPARDQLNWEQEAAEIAIDVEALKKLGEHIGKRVDQFGKEAANNLAKLVDGVKKVIDNHVKKNQTATSTTTTSTTAPTLVGDFV